MNNNMTITMFNILKVEVLKELFQPLSNHGK